MFSLSLRIRPQLSRARRLCSSSSKGSGGFKAPVTWTGLALMGVTGLGIVGFYQYQKESTTGKVMGEITTVGRPALGGPFVLVDHCGRPVTDATYRGQYLLLYFGFTYCPDICPNELVKIGKIVDRCATEHQLTLKPLFISVDPARDTVAQMNAYRLDFNPSIDFLTGTSEQIGAVCKAFRVYFSKVDEVDEDYLVDHSIVLYLISPDGEFLDFFTQRTLVDDVVKRIAGHVAQAKKV